MKKVTLLLSSVFVLFLASTSFSQVKDNAIKVNIVGAVVGQYQLAYERALSEKLSAQLAVGYISRGFTTTGIYESKTSGLLIIPEVRYYFTEALKGFYGGAFFRYRGVTTNTSDLSGFGSWAYEEKRTTVGGGLVLGYQALISDAVVFDIFLGPQFKSASATRTFTAGDENNIANLSISGTESSGAGIRFGFNLGFAF